MVTVERVKKTEAALNTLELLGIFLVLLAAFSFQFILRELPCPLCLLQRVGFIGMALGLTLNLRFGFRPSHYAVTLLSAMFTSFVALRQISLHIVPGTGHYGSAIFGLHMYTWSFILSAAVMLYTVILLSIDRQYLVLREAKAHWRKLSFVLLVILLLLALANGAATFLECGLDFCPGNPTDYLELHQNS